MHAEIVSATDPRIAEFEARIVPCPERVLYGQHILFRREGASDAVAWLHVMPCIWLGGEIHVVERSHWVYMARIAVQRPLYLAALFRTWHAMPEFPGMYPLTLISRPVNEIAMRQHLRIGFAPDKWLSTPGTVTYHAASAEFALCARGSRKQDQAL